MIGYEGLYEVSNLGRVRSLPAHFMARTRWGGLAKRFRAGRPLKPGPHTGGYLVMHPYRDGVREARTLHRVVAESFLGPRPPKADICHADNDKKNCCVENLRYGTHRENEADKRRHDTLPVGERSHRAKLHTEDVREIRRRKNETQQTLADEFGCTFSNISAIQLRKSWRHV